MQNVCWLLVGMNLPGKERKIVTQSSVFEGGQELALHGTLGFISCIAFFLSLSHPGVFLWGLPEHLDLYLLRTALA